MTEIIRCASDYNLLLSNFIEIYLSHFDQPALDLDIWTLFAFFYGDKMSFFAAHKPE